MCPPTMTLTKKSKTRSRGNTEGGMCPFALRDRLREGKILGAWKKGRMSRREEGLRVSENSTCTKNQPALNTFH